MMNFRWQYHQHGPSFVVQLIDAADGVITDSIRLEPFGDMIVCADQHRAQASGVFAPIEKYVEASTVLQRAGVPEQDIPPMACKRELIAQVLQAAGKAYELPPSGVITLCGTRLYFSDDVDRHL